MIENTFIKKIVTGVLRNRHTAALDKNIMHPKREWFIGLFIGLMFLSAGATWSFRTYHQFSSVTVEESSDVLEEVVYRETLVDTALFDFATRKKGYDTLKAELLSKRKITPPPVVEEVVVEVEADSVEVETFEIDSVQFQ